MGDDPGMVHVLDEEESQKSTIKQRKWVGWIVPGLRT